MKADELSKIFDTFTQADSSTTRCFGGTGLGLPLSKQLAKMLGGTITVSSEFNKGSRFTVVINTGKLISEEFIDALPKKTALSEILPEADSNTKLCGHILLAEDTLDNQRLISMYIHKLGADVTIVENGQLALDAALNGNFDLILMDMQMPVMDGIEAVQALRKKGYSGPIVALTANVMKEDRANCAAAGCDDFASKPIKRDLFNEILHRYLPSQVVEIEHPTSIVSDLIEEGPEFAELVELFVKQLPLTLKNIQDAVQQEQWSSLKTLTHDLKGVGGGMGFPMLTKLAQTIEFQLAKESYKEINNSINELNTMCESIYQGHNSDS